MDLGQYMKRLQSFQRFRCELCDSKELYTYDELKQHLIEDCMGIISKQDIDNAKNVGVDDKHYDIIQACEKHKNISTQTIRFENVVGSQNQNSFMKVYFNLFQCIWCKQVPRNLTFCKKCKAIQCRSCLFYANNQRYQVITGDVKWVCRSCLEPLMDPVFALGYSKKKNTK